MPDAIAFLMVATRPHTPRCFQGYRLFRFGCALMGGDVVVRESLQTSRSIDEESTSSWSLQTSGVKDI